MEERSVGRGRFESQVLSEVQKGWKEAGGRLLSHCSAAKAIAQHIETAQHDPLCCMLGVSADEGWVCSSK